MGLLELSVETVPSKLLTNLLTQRRTGKFCDVKLHVGGSWLWAHSSVLGIFSIVLHNCFVSGQKSKNYNLWSLNEPLEVVISELEEVFLPVSIS
jgi:BTB/POZ domain